MAAAVVVGETILEFLEVQVVEPAEETQQTQAEVQRSVRVTLAEQQAQELPWAAALAAVVEVVVRSLPDRMVLTRAEEQPVQGQHPRSLRGLSQQAVPEGRGYPQRTGLPLHPIQAAAVVEAAVRIPLEDLLLVETADRV